VRLDALVNRVEKQVVRPTGRGHPPAVNRCPSYASADKLRPVHEKTVSVYEVSALLLAFGAVGS
jgi:hypothetical protein